jgi:prepilin-type N-terminal cleavage/methylation domain-containing protein
MSRQRIKAFTIMEVVITMTIAAILMGITYTSYQIVNKSYRSFNAKHNEMAVFERLDELLKKDFNRAEIIEKNEKGIVVKSRRDTIQYDFTPDFILRISAVTDTFKIKNEDLATSFEDQLIDGQGLSEEENRIDGLNISLLLQNEKIRYHYHKDYSSVNLINRNPDALH